MGRGYKLEYWKNHQTDREMAVARVAQREIIEVPYQLPDGQIKPHMALVLSSEKLQEAEDGMFYAVLISSKNINPEFTIQIKNEWLNKPLSKQSFFVTHIVSYYRTDEVIQSFNNFVKAQFFDAIMNKVILSMFDIELE
ncbi:MAG: type II toxin-antitoxin system PemK/MazF family toxin [Prevotella sp.]|nr:type II toxin-antitoxin system PemK/MazF family toxin [Prevotella sp.]